MPPPRGLQSNAGAFGQHTCFLSSEHAGFQFSPPGEASQVRIYVPSEINARETFKCESHCQGLRADIKPEPCLFSLGSVTGGMDNEGHQGFYSIWDCVEGN